MSQNESGSTSTDSPARRRTYPRPAAAEEMPPLYLRVPQILRRYGIGRSTFYKLVKAGKLPRPFHPTGERLSVWLASELDAAMNCFRSEPQ